MLIDIRKSPGGGDSFPYVEHNQCISKDEIEKAWKFFEYERNFDE